MLRINFDAIVIVWCMKPTIGTSACENVWNEDGDDETSYLYMHIS